MYLVCVSECSWSEINFVFYVIWRISCGFELRYELSLEHFRYIFWIVPANFERTVLVSAENGRFKVCWLFFIFSFLILNTTHHSCWFVIISLYWRSPRTVENFISFGIPFQLIQSSDCSVFSVHWRERGGGEVSSNIECYSEFYWCYALFIKL